MTDSEKYPENIFISLNDLLKLEHFSKGFSFLASKQKVRSILGGKHASKLRGRGLDFEEVRNYVPGDDIRSIDWKVTARTQKTHSRVYSEEKEKPALIVVDQSKSMFFGSIKKTKSVVAAELAALAAFKVLKEGDRVGGVVFADNGIDIIYPKRDRKNILRFLEKIVNRNRELIDSKPVEFEKALTETLSKVKNIVTHDFLVIIISDFQRYRPELIKFITRISRHNDVILAKVYDPMEQSIPDRKLIAGDKEKQLLIDGNNAKLRTDFKNVFEDEFEQFKAKMKKHRIPVLSIDTVRETDVQIKEILKRT
ncbi:DUF58 domain-containing protein [Lutimonas zeaxanthinifaciens]|uniref:DUF58 domain-containing protein n=1 Tax=Lutimonas zeaxanthinifaciens TaxID=3060215 RepID=UPI00265C9C9C|nr:DUF58 domain-containing protein [Lutimonas sp. YSD2104]WKK66656.1 DUF58 domain-containing protein [Lutimonas sp. YSD2104]